MLIASEKSLLLSIDIQEKLLPAMHEKDTVLAHNVWLLKVAEVMRVPSIATLQYRKGLGPLAPEIACLISPEKQVDKLRFSAVSEKLLATPECAARSQIVLAGIEAHVCVLQTAVELREMGKEVFVVEEAIASRKTSDKALAISRMEHAGCHIVSREMVVFEWLREAGSTLFKTISKDFVR